MTPVRNRMKLIKIADRNQFGWDTAEEYQHDDLGSGSEDEKRLFRSERRAELKIKQRRRPINRARYQKPSSIQNSNFEEEDVAQKIPDDLLKLAPAKAPETSRKFGPCFKISIFSRTNFVYLHHRLLTVYCTTSKILSFMLFVLLIHEI